MITKLLKDIENGKDWEEEIFNIGCEIASNIAKQVFTELDSNLGKEREKDLRTVGKRKKNLVTRFGSFSISRNYYRENKTGKYHFLLDEKLGIAKHKSISPRLISLSTLLATLMPFRQASFAVNSLLPRSSSLSHQVVHSSLQNEASKYDEIQKAQTKALFEDGEIPPGLKQKETNDLFVETDGCWVNLQREEKKDLELKLGITYEGLKQIAKDKYRAISKTVFSGNYTGEKFWQGFSTKLNYKYKMSKVNNFYLGGDGAFWIKAGIDFFKNPKFYLDKFHQVQAIQRAFSFEGEKVAKALEALETNNFNEVLSLLKKEEKANPKRADKIKKTITYLTNNKDYLVKEKEVEGLGAMEGNVDKILANRLKKRGMSWRIDGAHNMAKMIEARLTEPLDKILVCYEPKPDKETKEAINSIKVKLKENPSDWLNKTIPVFAGPHSDRPWVKVLKEIVYS